MPKPITIRDIAREAGVSISLVSFVMNNRIGADGKQKYRVSQTTRDKILEVARRLDYQPNAAARTLRKGHNHVIGAILSDMANIFYGAIARELEDVAGQHGYTVLFGSSDEDPEKFGRILRSFMGKNVEGFIIVPAAGSGICLDNMIAQGVPFVVIDRHHPDYDVPCILTDNAAAMDMAVDTLLDRGAKNIAMVSYGMRISSMTDREERFLQQLPDQDIYRLPFDKVDEEAETVVDELIRKGTDGLVIASNVLSVAVIKALFRRGVRIQKDIQIVGFDYSNVYDVFDPPIPYILQPLPEITRTAADTLFRMIEAKDRGEDLDAFHETIMLPASLHHA